MFGLSAVWPAGRQHGWNPFFAGRVDYKAAVILHELVSALTRDLRRHEKCRNRLLDQAGIAPPSLFNPVLGYRGGPFRFFSAVISLAKATGKESSRAPPCAPIAQRSRGGANAWAHG
jgi:hypothetical protein